MAEPDPAIMLRRAAQVMTEIARNDLILSVEHGLGIAKLRILGSDADTRFHAITAVAAPPPGTQVEARGLIFAWLAPGEWLAVGVEAAIADWVAALSAQGANDLLVVDLSHARAAFLLGGAGARDALAAHCPLDLWQDAFPVDAVARSLLGDTTMFIARLADKQDAAVFRIIVDQTMAAYAGSLFAGIHLPVGAHP